MSAEPRQAMDALAAQIRGIQHEIESSHALKAALGDAIVAQTEQRFVTKRDPDGGAWAPWSSGYAATRRAGDSLLVDNSTHDARFPHLKDSFRWRALGDRVIVASEGVPYAGAVQASREFLGFGRADVDALARVAAEAIRSMFR